MSTPAPAPPADRPAPIVWPRSAQAALALLVLTAVSVAATRHSGVLGNRPRPSEIRGDDSAVPIDLNSATRSELLQLPGVGPGLADKILTHRDRVGRFRKVGDLRDVPGVGHATLDRLRPWLAVADDGPAADPPPSPADPPARAEAPEKPIDVNRAGLDELDKLPGIGVKIAQRIIDERAKRPFATVDELRRVTGIGPKTLEKLRPKVTVGPAEPGPSSGERY